MNTTAPSTPTTHSGRLIDFINARAAVLSVNDGGDQIEGFAKEFYLMVSQYVNTASNQISLQSCLSFPHLALDNITLPNVLIWFLLYNHWTGELLASERHALSTARFTWE